MKQVLFANSVKYFSRKHSAALVSRRHTLHRMISHALQNDLSVDVYQAEVAAIGYVLVKRYKGYRELTNSDHIAFGI